MHDDVSDGNADSGQSTRRRFLAAAGAGATMGLAGCLSRLPGLGGGDDAQIPSLTEFRGSGTLVEGRDEPGGTSIEDLSDLSGELSLYIGGGEGGIYTTFIDMLEDIYPDFTVSSSAASSSSLAQQVVEEVDQGASQADVFWSIDASSLAFVADNDAYDPLPGDAISDVPDAYRDDDDAWAGVAGRARSVPYNTNQLSKDDIPNAVSEFPGTEALQGTMGWTPTYGAFKSFVTAMRLIRGDDPTRQWLESMDGNGTERFKNEQLVSEQVADGAIGAGFANHYYAMRVKNDPARSDPPIDLAFTENDAGALVNVAGVLKVSGSSKNDLVESFVRHLLSAEAQEFFATTSFAYPMIPDVDPVGELPTIDQLDPPDIDLAELSNLEPTLDLMRSAGVLG
jgi:iron(III) transport system substrate-binding protein